MLQNFRFGDLKKPVAILLLAVLVTACAGNPESYSDAIGKFQVATAQTAAAVKPLIADRNASQRRLEFALLRVDRKQKLDINKLRRNLYDPDAIAVRVKTFLILTRYTDLLAELANSKAGDEWKSAAQNLKTSADVLITNIGKLTGDSTSKLKAFTGPLTAIVGAVGAEYIQFKRSKALAVAITVPAENIKTLSGLIREDLDWIILIQQDAEEILLGRLAVNYSRLRTAETSSEKSRLALLADIEKQLSVVSHTAALGPQIDATLVAFDKAHAALVTYAKSDKGPKSLRSLIATIEQYKGLADTVFAAFREIQAAVAG